MFSISITDFSDATPIGVGISSGTQLADLSLIRCVNQLIKMIKCA